MDLDKAISIIPICTGKKDAAEFINTNNNFQINRERFRGNKISKFRNLGINKINFRRGIRT